MLGAAVLLAAAPLVPAAPATLAVWDGTRWNTWWSEHAAPARWAAPHPVVARAVEWRTAQPGLEVGSVRFSGAREAWRFNVLMLLVDPSRFEFALHVVRAADGRALPWSTEETPHDAAVALNAGMFDAAGPWGWVVLDGQERRAPGVGPLSSAFIVDRNGTARIIGADSIATVRSAGAIAWAFQSYPTALVGDGEVPPQLRAHGRGVNLNHRDARIAIGTMRDGRILVALTRFEGLGGLLDEVPFGPTLPEMTAIMGALGVQRAMFLDGGISAQMAVRDARGALTEWNGLRSVPMALVARPGQYFTR